MTMDDIASDRAGTCRKIFAIAAIRSEERRVGKEWRSRRAREYAKEKKTKCGGVGEEEENKQVTNMKRRARKVVREKYK